MMRLLHLTWACTSCLLDYHRRPHCNAPLLKPVKLLLLLLLDCSSLPTLLQRKASLC